MPTRYDAYKVELAPNNRQRTLCRRNAGAARWAYNYSLRRRSEHYRETGTSINFIDLNKEVVQLKKNNPEFAWLHKVSSSSVKEGFRDLDRAFKNYFEAAKAGRGKAQHPRFKKRRKGIGSFHLYGCIHVGPDWIQLPRVGRVELKRRGFIPIDEKPLSATVSERAGHWFVSVKFRRTVPTTQPVETQNAVGVDLGMKSMAVLSDGTVYPNPNFYGRQQKRMRLLNRRLSRRQKGSRGYREARQQLARLHYRIACQRLDYVHKLTTDIIRRYDTVVIETLNVQGMHQNKLLKRRAHDSAIYETQRQLEYKAEWAGKKVLKADMWYPSSQICSSCGEQHKDLHLRDSVFCCPVCGFSIDRDVNAARNLKALAKASVAAGAVATARGDRVRPDAVPAVVVEAGSQQGAASAV